MTAQPMSEELVRDIENGELIVKNLKEEDKKEMCRKLIQEYGWDPNDANPKRLWTFGPEGGKKIVFFATLFVKSSYVHTKKN